MVQLMLLCFWPVGAQVIYETIRIPQNERARAAETRFFMITLSSAKLCTEKCKTVQVLAVRRDVDIA